MSNRVRGGKGYLMIDNRAAGGKLEEYNTLTCSHCVTIYVLNPERKRRRGFCARCNHYICDRPGCAAECSAPEQCVELAQRHVGMDALPRGKDGSLLFDPEILKEGKVY